MVNPVSGSEKYFRTEISIYGFSNGALTTTSYHDFWSRGHPFSYPIQDLFGLWAKFSSLSPIRASVKSAPYDMSVPPYQTNMYKKCQNIFMVSEYGTEYGSSVRLFDPGLIMVLGIGLIQK